MCVSECAVCGSVWCGEAEIYVLMSFPDIKFFPLNVATTAKTEPRAQARYILKHLYKHSRYLHVKYSLNSPFEQGKKRIK